MSMNEEHKQALAEGRRQARIIKRYLEALNSRQRGRTSDPMKIQAKIKDIEAQIEKEEDPLKRVELHQRRLDTEEALGAGQGVAKIADLENEFAEYVKDFSERKGLTYSAWREVGVPAKVLREAGVPRKA